MEWLGREEYPHNLHEILQMLGTQWSIPALVKYSATYGEELLLYLFYFGRWLNAHQNLSWNQESYQYFFEI